MTRDPLECEVYVDAPLPLPDMQEWLARTLGGVASGRREVSSGALRMAVVEVDEADEAAAAEPDGFTFYPLMLEIDPARSTPRTVYVAAVGSLLQALWASGWRAVAACDFEDELPYSGGYRDGRLTFPAGQ